MYPILFEIPGINWPIYSYGVMLGLSIVIGWYFTLYLAEKDGLPRKVMGRCYFWGIVASIIGARLLYLVANPDELRGIQDLFAFREGGLVAYGGFLGGLTGSYLFCRFHQIRIWAWADATAAPIALGLAITRIGCLMYGCCFGRRVTDGDPGFFHAIGIHFPNWEQQFSELAHYELRGAPAFIHHVDDFGLDPSAGWSFEMIPTQVFASLNGFLAVILLMVMRRYFLKFRGQLFLSFGVYYAATRFFFEILRDDTQRGTIFPPIFGPIGGQNGHLTTSQFIALMTVLASATGLMILWRKAKGDPEKAMFLGEGAVSKKEDKKPPKKSKKPGNRKKKKRS